MPRRAKYNITDEQLGTRCPKCAHLIMPGEARVNWLTNILCCPKCQECFDVMAGKKPPQGTGAPI